MHDWKLVLPFGGLLFNDCPMGKLALTLDSHFRNSLGLVSTGKEDSRCKRTLLLCMNKCSDTSMAV